MGKQVRQIEAENRPAWVAVQKNWRGKSPSLPALDAPALRQRWAALFGADPSPRVGRYLLSGRLRTGFRKERSPASSHRRCGFSIASPRAVGGRSGAYSETTGQCRDRADPRVARRQSPGHRARQRCRLPRPALQVAVGSRPRDHRHPLVGTSVFRPQGPSQGGGQWLIPRSGAAQSTPGSPPKKDWSRTTTRCTRSARRARRSSGARQAKAGGSSRRPTTTAAFRAVRWSGRRCSGCSRISARVLIDVVVVYKVDRLTRSLADFARMVELFDAHGVSFVAVTQQFNTTTSMGRLTLNVLLSFAQFEREVIGERIRDKVAASKRKGIWMGGAADGL